MKNKAFLLSFSFALQIAGIDTDRNEKVIHIKRETETGASEHKAVSNQIVIDMQAMVKERA